MSKRLASWLRNLFAPTRPARRRQGWRPQLETLEDRLTPSAYTVNALTDIGTGSGLTGDLRFCVAQANSNPGADTIDFAVTGTIPLTGGALSLDEDTTIDGGGAITIDGQHATQLFRVNNGVTASLSGLTLAHGSNSDGGGIAAFGPLTVTGCAFTGNTSTSGGEGGGIFSTGLLTVIDCTFTGNSASFDGGGGIFANGPSTVTGCSFTGNTSTGGGGAILNLNTLTVTDCTFTDNSTTVDGGALRSEGPLTVTGCTFTGNSAEIGGGAIETEVGAAVAVADSTFTGNSTDNGNGGAILSASSSGTLTVTGSTFTGNSAIAGGGLYCSGLTTVTDSVFTGNSAEIGGGGGINNGGMLTVTDCTLSGNSAGQGGGISNGIAPNSGTLMVIGSTLSGNSSGDGGGIFNLVGSVTVIGSTLSGNSALNLGGGIANQDTLAVTGCTLSGNSASNVGGGVANDGGGTAALTNCTLSGNSAEIWGGAVFNNVGGTLSVTYCTLSGNSAESGGGLFNRAILGLGATLGLNNTIVANSPAGGDLVVSGGTVSGSHNLIEDGTGVGTLFTDSLSGDPLLAPLGDNGGPTQTMALLPGSPAINHGTGTAPDQRGVGPVGIRDIGAFESRGFTITVTGGANQSADTTTAFALPLQVTVSSAFGEPVAGGVVTFTAPGSGASATLSSATAVIAAGGTASVTATANANAGTYTVTAMTAGAPGTAAFQLTNQATLSVLQQVADLIAVVRQDMALGVLTNGQGTSMINSALKKITETTGIALIDKFIGDVQKLVDQGKLSQAYADPLIDAALVIRDQLFA